MLHLFNNFSNKMIESARKGAGESKTSAGKIVLTIVKIALNYAWCVFIMALSLILVAGVTLLINKEIAQTVFKSEFSANLISIVGIFMAYVISTKVEKLDKTALGVDIGKKKIISKYIVGVLLGVLMFGLSFGFGYVTEAFKFVGINYESTVIAIVLSVIGFIIQGIFNTLFFKSYALNTLSKHLKLVPAVLISSALFSLSYLITMEFSILPLFNLFLLGILTSCVVLLTDNIWIAAALHSGWNIAQGTICGFNVTGNETETSLMFFKGVRSEIISGGAFGPDGGLIVTCILLIATIIAMWLMIRKSEENQKI